MITNKCMNGFASVYRYRRAHVPMSEHDTGGLICKP